VAAADARDGRGRTGGDEMIWQRDEADLDILPAALIAWPSNGAGGLDKPGGMWYINNAIAG